MAYATVAFIATAFAAPAAGIAIGIGIIATLVTRELRA
jgi:hypothetical protein